MLAMQAIWEGLGANEIQCTNTSFPMDHPLRRRHYLDREALLFERGGLCIALVIPFEAGGALIDAIEAPAAPAAPLEPPTDLPARTPAAE